MVQSPGSRPEGFVLAGRYAIQKKFGSGSTGTVYRVFDASVGRVVALKLIRTQHFDADGLERLQDEFRSIASLRHRQIATAYDFGYTEEGRLPFYTREYVPGTALCPGPPTGRIRSTGSA